VLESVVGIIEMDVSCSCPVFLVFRGIEDLRVVFGDHRDGLSVLGGILDHSGFLCNHRVLVPVLWRTSIPSSCGSRSWKFCGVMLC